MKFAIIIPSRNRPKNFAKSINMMIEASANPQNLFFYVIVDADDPQRQSYEKMSHDKKNIFLCIATPNQKLIYVNMMAEKAYQDECDAFLFHSDDAIFNHDQCSQWDNILQQKIEQIEDGVGFYWFDDSIKGKRLATHPIITRKWYEILGYFVPEFFYLAYMDSWVFDIAQKVNRAIYIPEIRFQHQHASRGYEHDNTYKRNARIPHFDEFQYNLYAPLRDKHAQMLTNYIDKHNKVNN